MIVEVTAKEVELVPDAVYFAKIHLTGLQATFGHASDVQKALTDFGFQGVDVYPASSSPPDFPDHSPFHDGATFFAKGTWKGEHEHRELPSQIKRAWTDKPAPPATPQEAAHAPTLPAPEPEPVQGVTAEAASNTLSAGAILAGFLLLALTGGKKLF